MLNYSCSNQPLLTLPLHPLIPLNIDRQLCALKQALDNNSPSPRVRAPQLEMKLKFAVP
jgi:hypothetical protein